MICFEKQNVVDEVLNTINISKTLATGHMVTYFAFLSPTRLILDIISAYFQTKYLKIFERLFGIF